MGRFRELLFQSPERGGAAGWFWLLGVARLGWIAVREFRLAHCFERAGTLAFATLISFIPLCVLLLGVAVQFGVGERFIKYAENEVFPLLAPTFQKELAQWLNSNISKDAFANSMVGAVGLVALASLVVTALGVLSTAERNFNRLWKVDRSRRFVQRLATFWIVLTASPFMMTASLELRPLIAPPGGWIDRFMQESLVLKAIYSFLVPVIVGFAGFTVLYRYLPATRVKLRSAMCAGFVAAVMWELSKQGFYFYTGRASVVTSLYGSLAIVPLFLVWIYLNCLILLWGCNLSYVHQNLDLLSSVLRGHGEQLHLPERFVALHLLEGVARAFELGRESPSVLEVAEQLRVDVGQVERVALRLCEQDVLVADPRRPGAFLLTRAPPLIQLLPVVTSFAGDALPAWVADLRTSESSLPPGSVHLFHSAQNGFADALRDKTLADLFALAASASPQPPGDRR